MSILFENLMFCIFIVANFIWLVQIWKTTKTFTVAVTFYETYKELEIPHE